jgi:hypothetical protein
MTIEEWADRVDARIAESGTISVTHVGAHEPTWTSDGRSVRIRVAEDQASLRAFFTPRGAADTAVPDHQIGRERMYMRGEAGAHEAARDIVQFLAYPTYGA